MWLEGEFTHSSWELPINGNTQGHDGLEELKQVLDVISVTCL